MAGWARERRRVLVRPHLPSGLPHAGRDTPGGIVHGHGRARAYPPSPARAGMKVRSETAHFFLEEEKRLLFPFRFISPSRAIMADDGGGSRLDRLLRLLETGSSPAARNEAARQIGELASAHPNQLPNLLRRVRTQIRNRAGARPPGRVRFRCAEDLADPRDSRATSPGSSARARSRRRDTVFHLRIHPAWLAGTGGEETHRTVPHAPFLTRKKRSEGS